MTNRRPGPLWMVASFLVALFAVAMARASPIDALVESASGAVTTAVGDIGLYVVGSIGTVAFIRIARRVWPAFFAPDPATEVSRRRNMLLAFALGQAGAFGGLVEPVRPGVAGIVFAGAIVAAMAVFGRDFAVRNKGAGEEKKAAHDAPQDAPEATFPPEGR